MNSLIMVVHNVKPRSAEILSMTEQCLSSLRDNTEGAYELILVDNGSLDDGLCLKFLQDEASKFVGVPVTVVHNAANSPVAAVWNRAISTAVGDTIVLLNNDVTFNNRSWLPVLTKPTLSDNVGAAGSRQLGWNGFEFLEGSFLAFRKDRALEVAENGKIFDEQFEFTCEDVDFCQRLRGAGYILAETSIERTSLVTHRSHGTLSWSNEEGGWNGQSILLIMHGCRIKLCRKYGKADRVDD